VLLTFGFGGQCFPMLARSGVKFHQRERLQSVQHSKIASILQPVCCVAGPAERSTMSFSAGRVSGQRRNPEVHEDGNRDIRREEAIDLARCRSTRTMCFCNSVWLTGCALGHSQVRQA